MKLRTQRRRVSPQAKLRYHAIRGFLRKALGSQSQNTIQAESSVSSNVESLKSKDQHNEDRQALSNYADCFQSESQDRRINENDQYSKRNLTLRGSDHGRRPKDKTETEVLYQTIDNQFQKLCCSDDSQNSICEASLVATERLNVERQRTKPKKKKREKIEKPSSSYGLEYNRLHNYNYNNNSQRTNDRGQLITSHGHRNSTPRKRTRRVIKKEPEVETYQRKPKYDEQLKRNKSSSPGRCYQHTPTSRRKCKSKSNVDQEFIADIIRRQYKPVKRFMTNESAISQFTVPECLDGPTYCTSKPLNDIPEFCSYHDRQQQHHYTGHGDYCDMRSTDLGSICDTRLYSNKRRIRPTQERRTEIYNDSFLYDVIPVKEKPSPKIRRRHTEYDLTDDNLPYQEFCPRAVPPSPRSQRPRLNLRSQFNQERENYALYEQYRKLSSKKQRIKLNANVLKQFTGWENHEQEHAMKRPLNGCEDTSSPAEDRVLERSQYTDCGKQTYANEPTNLNNTQDNKTENALFEIKDLLKNFLDELKKDVSIRLSDQSTSNGVHAQTSNKIGLNNNNRMEENNATIEINTDISLEHPLDLSYASNNNPRCYNEQCSEPPPYVSTKKHCCFSVQPTFPLNSMQPLHDSCLCNPKHQNAQNNKSDDTACRFNEDANETDLLIKEIHKFVTQDRRIDRRESLCQLRQTKTAKVALMTARSAGSHVSRRDAKVGTPRLQCCSRSCEAIGTPATNDTQKATGSYSERNFERVLELTDLEPDTFDLNIQQKGNRSKFSKVLQSLFKKKKCKTEETDELDESYTDNTGNSPRESRHRARRELAPAQYPYLPYRTPSPLMAPHECRDPYNCHRTRHPSHAQQRDYEHGRDRTYEHPYARPRPSAPPYHPEHYPNPNVCLQEIELTDTATQSEKKLSFFQKLAKKKYVAKPKQESTQSSSTQTTRSQKPPGLFNFKRIPQRPSDIALFSRAEHQKMVMGDSKLRDAVLKKMMRKKNPFSSRNLLLNTMLGKEIKPSFDPMSVIRSKLMR